MTDTVCDFKAIQPATTEGLDDFFVDVVEMQLHAVAPQQNATARSCTVKEASELLDVPTSTIYRRIKAGKYQILGVDEHGAQIISVQLHATAPQLDAVKTQLHAVEMQLPTQLHAVTELLSDITKRLEGAAVRIGYLESENQHFQEQVKLLPDLQSTANRVRELEAELEHYRKPFWLKFRTWFFGR